MVGNGHIHHRHANGKLPEAVNGRVVDGKNDVAPMSSDETKSSTSTLNLLICVGGIYASL